jgi:photosystem II stability/assembly factor-like uncharacterized protein
MKTLARTIALAGDAATPANLWCVSERELDMSTRSSFALATSAACLALIVVAAACGSSPAPSGGSSPSSPVASASTPGSAPTSASPSATPPYSPAPAAVPASFKAASVTFVSTDEAFVLGTAPGYGTLLVRTLDRGGSWSRLSAPAASLVRPGSGKAQGVWGTRFASPAHGFVFGNGLWETTDGGGHWVKDAAPTGQILSLATIKGQVLALVTSSPQSTSASLVRRPLAGGSWSTIAALKNVGLLDPTDLISTQAGTAAVLNGSRVLVTTNGGLSVANRATPSAAAPFRPSSVGVTSAGSLALLFVGQGFTGHTDKLVYTSASAGATWVKSGKPSNEGDGGTLAGGTPSDLVLATASAASWLDNSTDGGHSWATVLTYGDGGQGWADLGFTTSSNAVVVHGPVDAAGNADGRAGQLLLSSDGGATWRRVTF